MADSVDWTCSESMGIHRPLRSVSPSTMMIPGFTDDPVEHLDEHPELDVKLVDMDGIRGWAETDSLISDT